MICADWGLTRTVRPLKFPALERGLPRRFFLGFLAQLVEHPTFNRTVVSSNLTEPTIFKTPVHKGRGFYMAFRPRTRNRRAARARGAQQCGHIAMLPLTPRSAFRAFALSVG